MSRQMFFSHLSTLESRTIGISANLYAIRAIEHEFELFRDYVEKNNSPHNIQIQFDKLKDNNRAFIKTRHRTDYARFCKLFIDALTEALKNIKKDLSRRNKEKLVNIWYLARHSIASLLFEK